MHRFLQSVRVDHPTIVDYEALHQWSIEHYQDFWSRWLDASKIQRSGSALPVRRIASMGPQGGQFFPDLRLNFAANLLQQNDVSPAIISFSEARGPTRCSYGELRREVQRVGRALLHFQVRSGDRVAGYMPNIVETVVAMLACASIGAVWTACSPDFGVQGAVDRFGQVHPKLLFAPDGYVYHGKKFETLSKATQIVAAVPSIERLIVVSLLGERPPDSTLPVDVVAYESLPGESGSLEFVDLPFDHPLYVLYSSGTTGIPKCIVHGAGGTLLQHAKEHILHTDLTPQDNLFYFTTCGWMMWNWMVSALFVGCRITLFDGSPTFPDLGRLWQVLETQGVTHFGTSAKFIASCRNNISPRRDYSLTSLRVVLSTGSPLAPGDFSWVYEHVGPVQLSSICGGTDIVSCFVLGNPLLPVYAGEIQCMGLGMDVAAFSGEPPAPVRGDKGELICRTPFPSMPVYFWDDPTQQKYQQAYFDKLPNAWCHGDIIEITGSQGACGGIVVHGRSDATLKPGGVRIGTAEIYRLIEVMPEISDSVVIGQPYQGDIRIVLFVRLHDNIIWSKELQQRIKATIRAGATPRHVPAVMVSVGAVPYTRSGKKMELAVLDVVQGREPKNKEAMDDPTSLDCYRHLPELV